MLEVVDKVRVIRREAIQHRVDDAFQTLVKRASLSDDLFKSAQAVQKYLDEQVFLILEMIIKRGFGDPTAQADFVHGDSAIALLLEEIPSILQDAFGVGVFR